MAWYGLIISSLNTNSAVIRNKYWLWFISCILNRTLLSGFCCPNKFNAPKRSPPCSILSAYTAQDLAMQPVSASISKANILLWTINYAPLAQFHQHPTCTFRMYKTNPFIICAKLRLIIQQHKALLFNRVISTIDVLNLKCNMMYTIPTFWL